MLRQAADHQLIVFFFIVAPRLSVHLQRNQSQIFAVQAQWHIRRCRVAGDLALGRNNGFCGIQVKGQIDIANQILRRTIVVAVFGLGLLCHKKPFASSVKCRPSLFPLCQSRYAESSSFQRETRKSLHFVNTRGTKCPRPDAKLVV